MNKDVFDGFTVNVFLDEDGDYLAHFVEMPNVSAFSDTPEEALKELAVAWQGVKESYLERHKPIPQANSQQENDKAFNVPIARQFFRMLANQMVESKESFYANMMQMFQEAALPQETIPNWHEAILQFSNHKAVKYDSIHDPSNENTETIGNQRKEIWAELLRGLLPGTYQVVTNARIINQDRETSPNVDILVLKDCSSKQLPKERLYSTSDVAAAFECKASLRASHIADALQTCAKIKDLYPLRVGTPYRELHAPIVYGLLASSHTWKGNNSTPELNIARNLCKYDHLHVSHPRQALDLLCVADLGAWTSFKSAFVSRQDEPEKLALSSYVESILFRDDQFGHFKPIVSLISNLAQRLAWEDPTLRHLTECYWITNIRDNSQSNLRLWSSSIYSEIVRRRAEAGDISTRQTSFWDEWTPTFL